MRIVLGALAGSILMYVWVSLAHTVLGLGVIGFQQIPNEEAVTSAMQANIAKHGLYIFPWVTPGMTAEKEYNEKTKTSPSGLLLVRPAGQGEMSMTPMMIAEFVSEFVQCLMAALVIGLAAIGSYFLRVAAVTAIGVAASIATNASYAIWYGFPHDYTHVQMLITLAGYLAAGLAIGLIVKPKAA